MIRQSNNLTVLVHTTIVLAHARKAQLKKSMVGSSYLMSLVRYWIYACRVGIEEHILQAWGTHFLSQMEPERRLSSYWMRR